MENRTKKPLFNSYKLVMIPHLLPIEAKKRGVNSKNKPKWKELVKAIRSRVETRYKSATPDELWGDMKFKRFSSTQPKLSLKNTIETSEDRIYSRNTDYIHSYLEDKEVIESLKYINQSTRDWIDDRRAEKLCKISKYETALTISLGKSGIKSILKMPFVVDKRIYFSDIYIPKFKLAIEIVSVNGNYNDQRSEYKTEDLNSIGITRIILYNHEAAHPDIALKLIQKYNKG